MRLRRTHLRFLYLAPAVVLATTLVHAQLETWSYSGQMNTPRRDHTATLLLDGRVLIVGWLTGQAEIYDPIAGTVTLTASTIQIHGQGLSATRLTNGRVLVVGGTMSDSSAEIYDPASGTFAPTGAPNVPRAYHSATLLADGRVLIVAGQHHEAYPTPPPDQYIRTLASAEIYDPGTGTFTSTGALQQDRSGHTAIRLFDGRVLVLGGSSTTGESPGSARCLASAELFDPTIGTFVAAGSMANTRCSLMWPGVALLTTGKVLVAGNAGRAAELFDPLSAVFSSTGDMVEEHEVPSVTVLDDGRVLVAGGYGSRTGGGNGVVVASAEIYDPVTGTFTATAPMNSPRLQHTATRLLDGRVLVVGGYDDAQGGELATTELFVPADVGVAVSGTIYYSTTPLPGITVELVQGASALQTTITDGEGRYAFSHVTPGVYSVRRYGPSGYITWVSDPVQVANAPVVRDLDLPKVIVLLSPPSGTTPSGGHPVLTWMANPEAEGSQAEAYRIQINETSTWTLLEMGRVPNASYTVASTLTPSTQYTWQVDAYDAANHWVGTTPMSFTFTAPAPLPPPPIGDAGSDSFASERQTVSLDGTRSRGGNGVDPLTYKWVQLAGPAVVMQGAHTATPSFPAPANVVTLKFRLTVSDSYAQSASDDVLITVLEDAQHALFVSSTLGHNAPATTGGPGDPFDRLARAIDAAAAQNPKADVYVHAGEYPLDQTLTIHSGVSVYGGFVVLPGNVWSRAATTPTHLVGPYSTGTAIGDSAIAVDASRIYAATVLDGLTIESLNARNPVSDVQASRVSNSSIAIYSYASGSQLTIANNTIVAGRGANGRPAAVTTAGPRHGETGGHGGGGLDDDGYGKQPGPVYIWFNWNGAVGGGTIYALCPGESWSASLVRGRQGGGGGWGSYSYQRGGANGDQRWDPVLAAMLPGGAGGSAHSNNDNGRSNGTRGQDGRAAIDRGQGGQGGAAVGTFELQSGTRQQWFGAPGIRGTNGRHGLGGTGGGGGGGQYGRWVSDGTGAGGGGGGMGGCGGAGGALGAAGGGSFGIMLVRSSPTVVGNNITTRGGGMGGYGANGVAGGHGGTGGGGGHGSGEVGYGGGGGNGGAASGGGGGGGGAGGASCGIMTNGGTASLGNNNFGRVDVSTGVGAQIASSGAGGKGGTGGTAPLYSLYGGAGGNGASGMRANVCPRLETSTLGPVVVAKDAVVRSAVDTSFEGSASAGAAVFASTWAGSDVAMTLIAPSGRRIGRDTGDADVVHTVGPTFETYRIVDPEPGVWDVELFGVDVPPGGEAVTVEVTLESRNRPPVAIAGAPQTVECRADGAPASLSALASSDPDADALTFQWLDLSGGELSTEATFDVTLPFGVHLFRLRASDGRGGASTDETSVTVSDTIPPTLTPTGGEAFAVPLSSAGTGGVVFDVSGLMAATDTCDGAPRVSNNAPPLFAPGSTEVVFTAVDASGNTSQRSITVGVTYRFEGVAPPLNAEGTSTFKSGRTIPVKFRLAAADGSPVTDARATLSVARITASGDAVPLRSGQSCAPQNGNYHANLQTTGFAPGRYVVRIELSDGTIHDVVFTMR